MKDKVIEIVAGILGCSIDEVSTDSSLMNNLGADSLDMVEILMQLEVDLNIIIPDEAFEKVKTVGDIVSLVSNSNAVIARKLKPKTKKTIKKRVIKFVETTYEDGSVSMRPRTKGFNDFELVGILSYYHDLFKVNMIQRSNIPNND